jgi:hypothetical protein
MKATKQGEIHCSQANKQSDGSMKKRGTYKNAGFTRIQNGTMVTYYLQDGRVTANMLRARFALFCCCSYSPNSANTIFWRR